MVNFKKFDFFTKEYEPKYATEGSAGADLCAAIQEDIILSPFERKLIPTGVGLEIPKNFEGQIRPRSGLAIKHGISVLNSPGTIDSDYRGEIKVILINLGSEPFKIVPGMKIAQLVIAPITQVSFSPVETFDETERNDQGFGSTGV